MTVLTCGDASTKAVEHISDVEVIRADVAPVSGQDFLTWVMGLNFSLVEKAIGRITTSGGYDIIHAHDWLVEYAAETLKKAYHIPLVSTIHATEWGRNKGLHNDVQRYISSIEWRLAYESWQVIACSKFMKSELMSVFGIPEDKLQVIPNGVRRDEFKVRSSEGDDGSFRSAYAALDEKIVFYIGRLVHEKGVEYLIEAVPRILSQRNNVKFVITGTGPQSEFLKSKARHLGVADRVYFTGYVDDATRTKLMRIADIAVFPSLYEPFGIVALEAMVAGRPVVVSDVGGLAEIVTDGENGLKALPGNSISLADAVLKILKDSKLAASLAGRGLRDAINTYDWNSIARRTSQVYRDVVEESSDTSWVTQMRPYLTKRMGPLGLAEYVGRNIGCEGAHL